MGCVQSREVQESKDQRKWMKDIVSRYYKKKKENETFVIITTVEEHKKNYKDLDPARRKGQVKEALNLNHKWENYNDFSDGCRLMDMLTSPINSTEFIVFAFQKGTFYTADQVHEFKGEYQFRTDSEIWKQFYYYM
jgi:uncharacterized protein YpuA (DUF1002 family)